MHGIYSWKPVLNLKNLNVFSTDTYWIWGNKSFERFMDWVNKAVEISNEANLKTQIWVELIKVPKGRETDIYKSVVKAVDLGANAIATWSFKAEKGSELSCDDPENAWGTMIETVKKLKISLKK